MKKPLWIVVGLAVLVGGFIGYRQWRKHAAESAAPRFETVAVDRGPIVAKVTATGTLSALVTVQVGTQVSGRIKEILVDFNSPVKKGQVIARIEPALFQAAMESARANYLAAHAAPVNRAEVLPGTHDFMVKASYPSATAIGAHKPPKKALNADGTARFAVKNVALQPGACYVVASDLLGDAWGEPVVRDARPTDPGFKFCDKR